MPKSDIFSKFVIKTRILKLTKKNGIFSINSLFSLMKN